MNLHTYKDKMRTLNYVNCWKAKEESMPISSQAPMGKVQRLSERSTPKRAEARSNRKVDDIVRFPAMTLQSQYRKEGLTRSEGQRNEMISAEQISMNSMRRQSMDCTAC